MMYYISNTRTIEFEQERITKHFSHTASAPSSLPPNKIGGFEETMTRKEAALILGVRESSTPKRIKEAHRKLLILNHPDTGGSTYMAGKINEAKELLLQGRKVS